MPIPKHIRDAVRAKLLADLDAFFQDMENVESEYSQERVAPHVRLQQFVQWHGGNERMQPERDATTAEIEEAVETYHEGVLYDSNIPGLYRAFDSALDAPHVQLALRLKGLNARTTVIIEAALRKGYC